MEFAKENFVPVWKLFGGTKTLWYARFEAVREAGVKRNEKMRRESEAMRNK